jgi:2,3-bisphosphoglycerate-dependent phosphoglycerate mutase
MNSASLLNNMYLVRHGQATGNEAEAQLTDLGKIQAKELATFLREQLAGNTPYLITSPYKRATQTSSELSKIFGINYEEDDRLIERKIGEVGNLTQEELQQKLKEQFTQTEDSFPDGESNSKVIVRLRNFINELGEVKSDNPILIVTHRLTMALFMQQFDKKIGYEEFRSMTNPDVYLIKNTAGNVSAKRIWSTQDRSVVLK